jgi:hypothetical protein
MHAPQIGLKDETPMPPLAPHSPLIHQIPALTIPPQMAKPELFYGPPFRGTTRATPNAYIHLTLQCPSVTPLRVKHLKMGFHDAK